MAVYDNDLLSVGAVTPVLLSSVLPASGFPKAAIICVQDAAVRMTLHGAAPNNGTKNGLLLGINGIYRIEGNRDMENAQFLATSGTAVISVNWEQGE